MNSAGKMDGQIWPISQILIDAGMLMAVGIPITIIKKAKKISQRGFFCNDEDLMHPYLEPSFVENRFFHTVGCLISVTVILLIEYRKSTSQKIKLGRFKVPLWFYKAYCIFQIFIFGVLSTILITTVLKGSVGRLRPYFFVECSPNINCSLAENQHIYHTNYECTNKKFKQNTRLSFPSGHATFAIFCALFLAILIEKRLKCVHSKLFKHTLQVFLILIALYVGVSRVSDYKHFWSDILGGFFIGSVCAIFLSLHLDQSFKPQIRGMKPLNCVMPEPESVTSKT